MNQAAFKGTTQVHLPSRLRALPVSGFRECSQHLPIGRCMRRTVVLTLLVWPALTANAFEELNDAQSWIYGKPHLSTTVEGQSIAYRYRSQISTEPPVLDQATLSVEKSYADNKRDVALDFLSSERHLPLPDFTRFQGNPIIMAMLEHIAQYMGNETGGGALYFRNRIRDSLASAATVIEQTRLPFNGKEIQATVLTLSPFIGDAYLLEQPRFTQAVISITLSDAVPGSVVDIGVKSEYKGEFFYQHILSLDPGNR